MLKNINTLYKIISLPIFMILTFWQGGELTAGLKKEVHWEKTFLNKGKHEITFHKCTSDIDKNKNFYNFIHQKELHNDQLFSKTCAKVSPENYCSFYVEEELELFDFIESTFSGKDDYFNITKSDSNHILSFYQLPIEQKTFRLKDNDKLEELRTVLKSIAQNIPNVNPSYQLPDLNLVNEQDNINYKLSILITTQKNFANMCIEIIPTFLFYGEDDTIFRFRFLYQNMINQLYDIKEDSEETIQPQHIPISQDNFDNLCEFDNYVPIFAKPLRTTYSKKLNFDFQY